MNTLLAKLCSHLGLKPEHTALLNERDTSDVWRQFAIWLLVDEEYGVIRFTKPDSLQYKAIQQVAQLYINDCEYIKPWRDAVDAAWSAAEAASAAAFYAAARSANYAVWSATHAAWSVAWSAAEAAPKAADAAEDAWSAAATAAAHYECMADKLIELINAAPLKETP